MMNTLVTVVCILFAILVFSISSSGLLVKQQSPLTRSFFHSESLNYLQDYFRGELGTNGSLDLFHSSEVVVLYYYAPWSRDSQLGRRSFEELARMFHKHERLSFAAVNCWQPGGVCRAAVKIYAYPMILAHSGNVTMLYSGPRQIDHMVAWLTRLLQPVRHLRSGQEVIDFLAQNDVSVVGYFNVTHGRPSPPGYRAYLAAAFRSSTGTSASRTLGYGLITSPSLARYQLDIHASGDVVGFTVGATEWDLPVWSTAEELGSWVEKLAEKPKVSVRHIEWSDISDVKSERFIGSLTNGSAALVLVEADSPLYGQSHPRTIFENTLLEYSRCRTPENQYVLLDRRKEMNDERLRLRTPTFLADRMLCQKDREHALRRCCSHLPFLDVQCSECSVDRVSWDSDGNSSLVLTSWQTRSQRNDPMPSRGPCESLRRSGFGADNVLSACCRLHTTDSQLPVGSIGQKDRSEAKDFNDALRCYRSRLASLFGYQFLASIEGSERPIDLGDVACRHPNETLTFWTLDVRQNNQAMARWGLRDIHPPVVLLIDPQREVEAVLESPITELRLRQFIRSHHSGTVQRRSVVEQKTRTPADNAERWAHLGVPSRIERLSGDQLLSKLPSKTRNASNSDALVLFSAGRHHGTVGAIMGLLHELRVYLEPQASKILSVFSVDVSRNDVPFQLDMPELPALLYFSRHSESLSWRYPSELPFSAPSLLSFVLSRASPELRWRLLIDKCNARSCLRRNMGRCRRHRHTLQLQVRRSRDAAIRATAPSQRAIYERKLERALDKLRSLGRLHRLLSLLTSIDPRQSSSSPPHESASNLLDLALSEMLFRSSAHMQTKSVQL